ncbi:MAG: type I-U CRISPR-associated helicase/endonuclease Cas3 [Spirochaetaceae bacterium]|nr:type I-U CRISPR-associated helicase/endonuclease Cas3 [Spirochaetaceae bacterium]
MGSTETAGSASQEATFTALTAANGAGYRPFGWQIRLLGRLVKDDVPTNVEVPTGLGKTAVMALWLMALAAGTDLPRRLMYVIDRRAVVDHATRFAERLRRNLPSTPLADKLGLGDRPLPISTPRGGFAENDDWLDDPSRPAIVVRTVDMAGSSLLFSGYGVSRRMRPHHAGLLGCDTLFVLDDAHLFPPFETLLRDFAARRDHAFGPTAGVPALAPTPAVRSMSLSAMGRDSAFRLQDDECDDPVVRERLTARKRLALMSIHDPGDLSTELARRALSLAFDPPARVLVCCDRCGDAMHVKSRIDRAMLELVAKEKPDRAEGVSKLLIAEIRAYERQRLERWLEHHGFLGRAPSPLRSPAILVATSGGEAGVDLDADHLVCDLVAHERMVQRLGRVNRRGVAERTAHVDVLIPSAAARGGGPALDACKAILARLPRGADGRYDASPLAVVRLQSDPSVAGTIERATTPAPLHPELTRPVVEAWAMTSLTEHAGRPEVEPWLRGWEGNEEPRTAVVWRKYLPSESIAEAFFECAPIHPAERLEAACIDVSSWLFARADDVATGAADHDGSARGEDVVAVVLNGAGEVVTAASLNRLQSAARDPRRKRQWERSLAGATLVLSAAMRGLADGMLDQHAVESVATADADEKWQRIRDEPGSEQPMVRFRVRPLRPRRDGEGLENAELDGWRHVRTFETEYGGDGRPRRGLAVFAWPGDAGDGDVRSTGSWLRPQQGHTDRVVARVSEMVARLELPAADAEALLWAARLHGCRHELCSLLKAEQVHLPAETRDLILHLVAAHQGRARPTVTIGGCEAAPPSVLVATACNAALRYARLQRRYGIWGLAWREAILRAADRSTASEGAVGG